MNPLNWSLQKELVEDFESGTLNSDFIFNSSGVFSSLCGVNNGGSAHYFSNSGSRFIETIPFTATAGTNFSFYLYYGSGLGSCDAIATNDYVIVEYSVNGGPWIGIQSVTDISNFYEWNQVSVSLPSEAIGADTRLRIVQATINNPNFDVFAIDDMKLDIGLGNEYTLLPDSGIVAANDSLLVSLIIDVSETDGGFYQESLPIISNDPINPIYNVPVFVTLEGQGEIEYNGPLCSELGGNFLGTSTVDSVYIENSGCEVLNINNITSSNNDISVVGSPSMIEAYNGAWIYINFSPSAVGTVSSTLGVVSDGGSLSICIEGEGLETPAIKVSPNVLLLSGEDCPDSLTTQFYIHNTSNGLLNWSFQKEVTEDFELGSLNTDFIASSTGVSSSDCGSYEGALAHRFENVGTRSIETVPFTADEESSFSFSLRYGSGGLCDLVSSNDYFRVQYSYDGSAWFEILSVTDISSYYIWNTVTANMPIETYGSDIRLRIIQATTNSFNFDVFAIDNMVLTGSINGNLTLSPENGDVQANDSTLVTLNMDASNTNIGFYQESIKILSNDPANPAITVPVVATIDGQAQIEYNGPTCIDMGGHFVGVSYVDSVYIENSGCETLNITNITTSQNDFGILSGPTSIDTDDGDWIYFSYTPSSIGLSSETLDVISDGGQLSICVEGEGVDIPVISVSPNPIVLGGANCPDSISTTFYIYNTGNGPLNWTLQSELSEGFESETINSDFIDSSTGVTSSQCGAYEGDFAHYFTAGGIRSIETISFSANAGTEFSFYLLYGSGGACETLDGGDYVNVEYSLNGGPWVEMISVTDIANYQIWNQVSVVLPPESTGNLTKLRIVQPFFAGLDFDVFAIDNLALNAGISNALNVSPEMGTILGNDSVLVSMGINISAIDAGSYVESISFLSNDPVQSSYSVPVAVSIDGQAQIEYNGPACFDMGVNNVGLGSIDSVYIENTGCEILNISNITTSHPDFLILDGPASIDAYGAEWISLAFTPGMEGIYTDSLNIDSDLGLFSICITGEGIPTPNISVTPQPVVLTGNKCPGVIESQFYVHNLGNGTLDWSVNSNVELIEDFESGVLNPVFIANSSGSFSNACGTNSGSFAHYFTGSAARLIETVPFTANSETIFSFYLQYGSGGSCSSVEFGEHVRIDYSLDGQNWVEISSVQDITLYQNWNQVSVTLPTNAYSSQTRLRIIQVSNSGLGNDEYAIDDLLLTSGSSANLVATPDQGTLLSNDSILVNLSMNVSEVDGGFYQEVLNILSNDPLQPVYNIPVEITVFDDLAILEQVWLALNAPDLVGWVFSPNAVLDDNWEGITMSADGCEEVELNLSSKGLTGTLAPEIGGLTSLTSLDLSNNSIYGSIPSELGNLVQLIDLKLHVNDFMEEIPIELGNLSQLNDLRLNGNKLTGNIPTTIGGLVHLDYLLLSQNQLSGVIPDEFGNLSELVWLFLNNNELSGSIPENLGLLSQLSFLSLDNNMLEGSIPAELANLSQLSSLAVHNNALTGTLPPELGSMTALNSLRLHNNLIEGCIPSSYQTFCSGVVVDLGPNPLLINDDFILFCDNGIGICPPPCLTDFDGNGITDGVDFVQLLGNFNVVCEGPPCPTDVNSDGVTDGDDFAIFLGNFGLECN